MGRRKSIIILIMAASISGAISFYASRMTAIAAQQTKRDTQNRWLSDAPEQVAELEEHFSNEAENLVKSLLDTQKSLASALNSPHTTDEALQQHIESLIRVHAHLMKRVGEHMVELRAKLPGTQRLQLVKLSAEAIRGTMRGLSEQGGWCGAAGNCCPADAQKPVPGCCENCVCRNNPDSNADEASKCTCIWRQRGKGGFARKLKLSEEQIQAIGKKDRTFEVDSARLRTRLLAEQTKLLNMFEDIAITDKALLQQIDSLISAHNNLERRIAEHVLVLRSCLTVEQQKWLIGICRRLQDS